MEISSKTDGGRSARKPRELSLWAGIDLGKLMLGGAEEPPEARPRRSKTTKKVKKIIKNAVGDHARHSTS